MAVAAGGCAVLAAATAPAPSPRPAAAAAAEPQHRAALIVDTGREVRRICVRFAEDFISGAELLVRAKNVDPVFREYAGKGKAVCALCGVGCPADDSCLTCGGNDYWSYSRAPAGSSKFQLSGAGASSTRIRDGDVEGWRWSNGLVPAYASVDQVCGPAPGATSTTAAAAAPTSTTAAAAGSPTPTTAPGEAVRANRNTTSTSSAPTGGDTPTSLVAAAPPTSTTGAVESDDDSDDTAAPPTVPTGTTSGGGGAPLVTAGVLVAALLGWAAWLRRTRTARSEVAAITATSDRRTQEAP